MVVRHCAFILLLAVLICGCTDRPDATEIPGPVTPAATATPVPPAATVTASARATTPRPTLAALATARAAMPTATMAPAAESYLREVLTVIEARSLLRDEINWPAFRAEVMPWAAGAATPVHTYPAIRMALIQLQAAGLFQSAFLTPEQWQTSQAAAPGPEPSGTVHGGRVAYIHLPGFSGPEAAANAYATHAQEIIRELDASAPCGWIVDLSDHSGGNMWPVLAGVGPLLGEGVVGGFVGPEGELEVWFYRNGQAGYGETVLVEVSGDDFTLSGPMPPVAILIGPVTASAGEAVAVAFRERPDTRSFGKPTVGFSNGAEGFSLSDGAMLVLATSRAADRTGVVYDGPLRPDALVLHQPDVAALEWLLEQPACAAAGP